MAARTIYKGGKKWTEEVGPKPERKDKPENGGKSERKS